ncbi:cell wall-binding repeat-containing protein [Clostridium sp. CX1]|uniref:cell wall-binding repeat-containing protein n=1 Tax=Clostridium sp. CX1 TaxID=2978346 RepID=UPI0021C24B51|nr:cell wall-binding repeat-containing protein [Clostridium sp. CX1]MCT8977818.1 cell wall-binding repeat-containing protein [Clostridium sp. CX1]
MFKCFKNKKWTAALITVFMLFSLLTPGAFTEVKAEELVKVFDLIEITDFHGALEDSSTPALPAGAVLANNIKDIKNSNPDRTLIMGGGDLYQGTPMSNVLFGVPVQKLMSSIGMEVTTLGNHEFDWGLDKIINTTMKDAKYSIICANLYDKNKGKRVFEPYKIITKDGVKIAVIGAISTETPGIVLPANVQNYKFTDPTTELNAVAKEIKNSKKADVVLALLHEGSNADSKTGPVFDIADKLSNVDAVLGGHSHTVVQAKSKNGIPVVIGKAQGKGFIDLKMTIDETGKISFNNVEQSYIAIDNNNLNGYKAAKPVIESGVAAIVEEAKKAVGPTFNEVIGHTNMDLTRKQSSTPFGESYLGNWTTDIIRKAGKADVAFQNNGGIRVDVTAGDITVGTIFSLIPFDNEVVTVNMNKIQLTKVFEQAVADKGKGIQVSGLKVTYDTSKAEGNRVISLTREDGKAISESEVLKVATNDFLASGGDGFPAFTESEVKATFNNPHILVRDVLIEDVRANKGIVTTMNNRLAVAAESTVGQTVTIKGEDRYETAAKISQAGWEKESNTAIIVNGGTFADALTAAPLAKQNNAPILLTQSNKLPETTKAELRRLKSRFIIIVGGEGVVSKEIETELNKVALENVGVLKIMPKVMRIGGSDRFETSVNVAKAIENSTSAVIANGYEYADSLSISSIAAAKGIPILLTDKNKLPEKVSAYLSEKKLTDSYIVGLEGSVDKNVEAEVNKVVSKTTLRLGGRDRYETNISILKYFEKDMSFDKLYLALGDGPKGDEFADALSGAALAAEGDAPMILTNNSVSKETLNYMKDKVKSNTVIILIGGQTSIPKSF